MEIRLFPEGTAVANEYSPGAFDHRSPSMSTLILVREMMYAEVRMGSQVTDAIYTGEC